MAKRKKVSKQVIGRHDYVDIPELDLFAIPAKIDTGAYTSALHVKKIKPFLQGTALWVRFWLIHHAHPGYPQKSISLPVFAQKNIRSSSGEEEFRYIIRAQIVLFGKSYLTEFSLADRSKMDTPVLLGRKLLYRRFIVDVAMVDLSAKELKKEKNILRKS